MLAMLFCFLKPSEHNYSHLEELILRDDPKDALCLVLICLGVELSAGGQGAVLDDETSLPSVVLHLDVVEPVRVALDDLDVVEVPRDIGFLDIDL
jgi:hypothetical protein